MDPELRRVLVPEKYPDVKYLPVPGLKGVREDKVMSRTYTERLLKKWLLVEEKMDGKGTMFQADRFFIFAEDLLYVHSIHYRVPARYAIFDIFDLGRDLFMDREGEEDVFNAIRKGVIEVNAIRKGMITVKGQNPYNFFMVPMVAEGKFKLEELPFLIQESKYAVDAHSGKPVLMEGIVVKPIRELFAVELKHLVGKIVRKDFIEGIETHYLKKQREKNKINPQFG